MEGRRDIAPDLGPVEHDRREDLGPEDQLEPVRRGLQLEEETEEVEDRHCCRLNLDLSREVCAVG